MSSERGRRMTAMLTAIVIAAGSIAGGAGKLQEAYAAEESEMTTETAEKPVVEKNTEEKETERKEEKETERETEVPTTEGREPEKETMPESEKPTSKVEEESTIIEPVTEKESTITEPVTEEESTITEPVTEKESIETRPEAEIESKEESAEPETGSVTDWEALKQVRPYRVPTMERTPTTDVTVPIYDYEIINVVVPVSYAVAFNPYRLTVRTGGNKSSDKQVLSGNYGIVNKSSMDVLVTVTLLVEDQNGDKITFVDSAEEAINADKDIYAVYLTAVPADERGIRFADTSIDKDIEEEELAAIEMAGAEDRAVTLYEGRNQMVFRLSKARYDFREGMDIALGDTPENGIQELLELKELASDGNGATAFTFDGVMNENADWTKLKSGIRISVVYTYERASGDEKVLHGTNAMVSVEE